MQGRGAEGERLAVSKALPTGLEEKPAWAPLGPVMTRRVWSDHTCQIPSLVST